MKLSNRRRFIFQITLAYGLLALIWIFLSDRLLLAFVDIEALVRLSTAKGIFFVLVSAVGFLLALHAVPAETEATTPAAGEGLLDVLAVQPWPRWLTYVFAALLVAAMVVVRQQMPAGLNDRPLLILFMVPIVLAALLGGFGPGLAATLTAAACSGYFTLPPVNSFAIAASHDVFQWSLLLVNGLVVSLIGEAMHRSRLREQARWRQLDTAHLSLRQSEERLGLFIEHAPAALAMFDREMRYLAASRRWRDDYGLGEAALIGQSHYHIFPELGDEWKAVHQRGMAGEVIRCDEDRFVRADGRVQWLRWEMHPWHAAGGSVGGIVIFSEDITRFKQAEEEILRLNADLERRVVERTAELSAANRELDSFAYAVSHDLRAPLRAMNGFSQALIEDFGDTLQGEARLYLDQIILGSRKMGELIDGLLTLSRCTRGQLRRQEVDLSTMAAQLLAEMAREEPDRRVRWQIEPAIVAWVDRTMLEVALRNLLANAWKYTARREEANIRMYTEEAANRLRVCIADNGAGFEPAHADKLFQPFQRLHRQEEFPGIGIGLATVQRIVHRHGGDLTATGAKEQGAVFCFSLPRHDERND